MKRFLQHQEINKLKEMKASGQKIALSGDGKFDSPGKNKIHILHFLNMSYIDTCSLYIYQH